MDMKINKETLRRERELRAWTQSHLAEVADLSMRTVQRIERSGNASYESASALASALNLDLKILMAGSGVEQASNLKVRNYRWGFLGIMASALLALGWWSTASAEQITVSLFLETPDSIYSDMAVVNKVGQEGEIQLDDQFQLVFNSERQGKYLLLTAKIYHRADNEYRLFSNPAVLVESRKPAALQVNSPDGQHLKLQFLADF